MPPGSAATLAPGPARETSASMPRSLPSATAQRTEIRLAATCTLWAGEGSYAHRGGGRGGAEADQRVLAEQAAQPLECREAKPVGAAPLPRVAAARHEPDGLSQLFAAIAPPRPACAALHVHALPTLALWSVIGLASPVCHVLVRWHANLRAATRERAFRQRLQLHGKQ